MGEDVPLTEFDSGDDSGDDGDERGGADGRGAADDGDHASGEQVEPVDEPADPTDEPAQPVDEPADPTDEPAEADAAETPSLTYTSSPDGAPCAACGETVEKRWRAGEGGVSPGENRDGVDDPEALVCPDCKEW